MRSAAIILLPLAILIGAFYFFVLRGRPVSNAGDVAQNESVQSPATQKYVPTTLPSGDPSSVVGPSGNVWIQTRDRRTGKLANEFRSQRFDPRPDGAVDVVFPQARFYGSKGGIVTLEGTRGKVSLSQPGDRSDPHAMGSSSPTEGDMQDVIIRFYDDSPDDEPSMIVQMPAVHFDAVANRVATVDSVVNGVGVPAEQMPVTVRGRDFDFDGYGLQMSWNDRDDRLENLEINRGERLLIKNVERFTTPSEQPAATATSFEFENASPAAVMLGLVEATPTTATASGSAAAETRRRQLYHATFDRDVRITRDGTQIASGDVMRVVLPLGDAKKVRAVEPPVNETRAQRARRLALATQPVEASSVPSIAPAKPAEPIAGKRAATKAATSRPRTAPTSPIEVRWNGKLTVKPVELIADSPREQMVELVGAPAWVEQNGSRADGRLIRAEPTSGHFRVEPGGPVKAISLHDVGGAELRSRSVLTVDRPAGITVVNGGGTLITPATQGQTAPTTASWSERLTLKTNNADKPWLQQVMLEGEANIANPQLKVASQTLRLGFDEPTKSAVASTSSGGEAIAPADKALPATDLSALRSVVALGNAKIDIGEGVARRSLASQTIQLGLVAGESGGAALRSVHCIDAVALNDAKGFSLASQTLDATLKPTSIDHPQTQDESDPLASIESLVATREVQLHQADGSSGAGDRLEVATTANVKQVMLDGLPARAASARGALESARIFLNPATGDVDVPGPGRFVGQGDAQKQAGTTASTMAIAWLDSMKADGATGVCDLYGGVRIDGTSASGTHLIASAQKGRALFAARPTTIPSTGPATAATSRPATPALANASMDALRSVQLTGDVDVASELVDIRTSSIQTQQLDIDLENGVITSPTPGRLLVIDGHIATTQPTSLLTSKATTSTILSTTTPVAQPMVVIVSSTTSATRPTTQKSSSDKFGPGSLAVAWKNSLVWKMHDGDMIFDGGVRLGYERAGTSDPVRLDCERIVCALAPVQSGKGVDQMSQRIDLHTVTAERNVTVRSKLASFDADQLVFDTVTGRATATGDANTPVEVFDAEGTSRVGFSGITWNLQTGLIEDFRDIQGRLLR